MFDFELYSYAAVGDKLTTRLIDSIAAGGQLNINVFLRLSVTKRDQHVNITLLVDLKNSD